MSLTHEEIRAILARVSYKPGWTIVARRHPFGTYVLIDATVPDAEYVEQWRRNPYPIEYIPSTRIGVRACVPQVSTERDFLDWLAWRMIKVERHESREFFQVDGKPWDSPHKREQPKHDFHVRKRDGAWHVYAEDPLSEDQLGRWICCRITMQEAYRMAIRLVVRAHLSKGDIGPIE